VFSCIKFTDDTYCSVCQLCFTICGYKYNTDWTNAFIVMLAAVKEASFLLYASYACIKAGYIVHFQML